MGTSIGIVWSDIINAHSNVFFCQINKMGTLIGSIIQITDTVGQASNPDILWDGTHYVIVWEDNAPGNYELYLCRIDIDNNYTLAATRLMNVLGDSRYPSIVWNGTLYCIAWSDDRAGSGNEIYCSRFTVLGVQDGSP